MSIRLDALRRQHTEVRDGIAVIEKKAVDAGRDLSEAEAADVDALYKRAETLLPEIEAEGAKVGSIDAAAAVLARVAPQQLQTRSAPSPAAPELTVGEWMVLHIRSQQGDQEAKELLTRAVAGQITSDNTGILPVPIVGPVTKFADSSRPVFNSFTHRPMPGSGKTFTRPRISQRVNVAEQVNELDELVSRKMTVVGDNVTKKTYGGVLELSEQDIDWTDPSAMSLVIQDFTDYYAEITEGLACAFLTTTASASAGWTGTNPGTIITSVLGGVSAVYTASKRQADTLWLSFDQAIAVAGMSNTTTNVSAMSLLRQALSDAGMNLKIVVGPQLPTNTRIIGDSGLIESYEDIKGLVQAPDVSRLGVVMAYRGYEAFFALAQGFVKLA